MILCLEVIKRFFFFPAIFRTKIFYYSYLFYELKKKKNLWTVDFKGLGGGGVLSGELRGCRNGRTKHQNLCVIIFLFIQWYMKLIVSDFQASIKMLYLLKTLPKCPTYFLLYRWQSTSCLYTNGKYVFTWRCSGRLPSLYR